MPKVIENGVERDATQAEMDDKAADDAARAAAAIGIERQEMVLTRVQFAIAAFAAGIITEQEAEDWAGPGTLPALAMSAIATLDPADQGPARIRFRGANEIRRTDAFIALLQAAASLTDTQVDDLFRAGMAL